MNFDTSPKVMVVNPSKGSVDVDTTLQLIMLGFNTDLDINYLDGNFRLEDRDGKTVPTYVTYDKRTVSVHIKEQLSPNVTYTITVFGDNNLNDGLVTGIRNVFGTPMGGDYHSSFTTAKTKTMPAPIIKSPTNQSTVNVSKPTFSWEAVTGATAYEIVVSDVNTLDPKVWPTKDVSYALTEITPDVDLPDGQYYWKVRAVAPDLSKGEWTEIQTFNIDTQKEGTVSDDDTLPPMDYDPFLDTSPEIVETFPLYDAVNIKTNLETVYVRVLGEVTLADIEVALTGEHVTGEGEDHGEITGKVEVHPQTDGTTIIAFTPNPIT